MGQGQHSVPVMPRETMAGTGGNLDRFPRELSCVSGHIFRVRGMIHPPGLHHAPATEPLQYRRSCHDHTPCSTRNPEPGYVAHHARAGSDSIARAGPHRMPGGGGIRDSALKREREDLRDLPVPPRQCPDDPFILKLIPPAPHTSRNAGPRHGTGPVLTRPVRVTVFPVIVPGR